MEEIKMLGYMINDTTLLNCLDANLKPMIRKN